ncbi:winged helix-turn-helix transcriptional regulator [Ekhidna sp.]|uniref:winged helix-turn-helix transcriptional regulator n=1 Tax=Ekhidna sp. TaxID=2608089 RepID=UPI003CCC371F
MDYKFRCNCPFTSAIDILGDRWMLVIVKQILVDGKETFKEFVESEEAIATNILSMKLKLLEKLGIIDKIKLPTNKKTNIYRLTSKGLELTPILVELALWSDNNLREVHPSLLKGDGIDLLRNDKEAFAKALIESYQQKLDATNDKLNEQTEH